MGAQSQAITFKGQGFHFSYYTGIEQSETRGKNIVSSINRFLVPLVVAVVAGAVSVAVAAVVLAIAVAAVEAAVVIVSVKVGVVLVTVV